MEKQIPATVERAFGPIVLLKETPKPAQADILGLAPPGPFAVCDFHVQGAETFEKRDWGYQSGRMSVIDHHANDKRWERHVSSGNLADVFVRSEGPIGTVFVNHTDCDSVLSAGIASGLLEPKPEYLEAVIAADHTGEANPIADLLQALQDERDLEYSFECLKTLKSGSPLPVRAEELLSRRQWQRQRASDAVKTRLDLRGRLACLNLDEKIESELVAPLIPDAWAVAIAFPSPDWPGRTELKLRLTAHAPRAVTLRRLDMKAVDPSFGGRWNAGSNKRGGGSSKAPAQLFALLEEAFKPVEEGWMFERALQIAAEAHAGQTDKAGRAYIAHPLRVMAKVRTDVERVVALLHDVVEDCEGWTFERLKEEGFSDEVLEPLRLVTKEERTKGPNDCEAYFAFIDRCTLHPVATVVKLADIEDNMDLGRIKEPSPKDHERVRKYALARQRLLEHMQGKNPDNP